MDMRTAPRRSTPQDATRLAPAESLPLTPLQKRLLDDWQRRFPLTPRPFDDIARELGVGEDWVIAQISAFLQQGLISRVGPVFRPNTVGASTLVAAAVPPAQLAAVAARINRYDEVNHNYQREHRLNLWFVVTTASGAQLEQVLQHMERTVRLPLLRLPLLRDYHIDLGFTMFGETAMSRGECAVTDAADHPPLSAASQAALVAEIQNGLPLTSRPYQAVAHRLGWSEARLIDTLRGELRSGVIRRFGVVVRHRALGYRANAMVVWDVPEQDIDVIGRKFGGEPHVTLCYRRPRIAEVWPYNLFCMIHARQRGDVEELVNAMVRQHLAGPLPHEILFSVRCFRQRGARYQHRQSVATASAEGTDGE